MDGGIMQNSDYDPQNIYDFEKSKLNKDAKGVIGTAAAGQVTNLDLTITDDMLITGGGLLAKGAAQGDTVDFQILAGQNLVAQYVTNWAINPDQTQQETPKSNYPAKLPAGLTLRLVYHSVGNNDVWIAINYDREKIMK
jgi:hypothetical protein